MSWVCVGLKELKEKQIRLYIPPSHIHKHIAADYMSMLSTEV